MRELRVWVLVLLVAGSIAGCYDWRAEVSRTAGFEHNCPPSAVTILSDDGNEMARSVQLNVCGSRRLYRDVGGTRMYLWVDATQSVDGDGRRDTTLVARSERAMAAELPPEVAMEILRQLDTPVLECTGGEAIAIQATVDRSGHLTGVTGLGTLSTDVRSCVSAAIARVAVDTGGRSQRITLRISTHRIDGSAPTAGGSTPPVSAGADADAHTPPDRAVRARLDTAAPRVLTCVGSDSVVVDVTWAAGETVAHAVFRGVTDPMTTECALAAIGELTLSAPAPADGRLMHALAR